MDDKQANDEPENEVVWQLVYASAATRALDAKELAELLAGARTNNTGMGISGMLLYHQNCFIQALEGDREVVEALFDKIEEDPRHDSALVLFRGEVPERSFGSWSMGFHHSDASTREKLPGLSDFLRRGYSAAELEAAPGSARKILQAFREGRFRRSVETGSD